MIEGGEYRVALSGGGKSRMVRMVRDSDGVYLIVLRGLATVTGVNEITPSDSSRALTFVEKSLYRTG
jgi:hypothetical protein